MAIAERWQTSLENASISVKVSVVDPVEKLHRAADLA
jgi:hypothetical protein